MRARAEIVRAFFMHLNEMISLSSYGE